MHFWGLLDDVPPAYRRFFLAAAVWTLVVTVAVSIGIGLAVGIAGWGRSDALSLAEVLVATAGVGWIVVAALGVARSFHRPLARLHISADQADEWKGPENVDPHVWNVGVRNSGDGEATDPVLGLWTCELVGYDRQHWVEDAQLAMPGGIRLIRLGPFVPGHAESVCTIHRELPGPPRGWIGAANVEGTSYLNV